MLLLISKKLILIAINLKLFKIFYTKSLSLIFKINNKNVKLNCNIVL